MCYSIRTLQISLQSTRSEEEEVLRRIPGIHHYELGGVVIGCLAECVEGGTVGDWKRKPDLDEPQYFHLENKTI